MNGSPPFIPAPRNGVLFVLPTLETGLDPFQLHEIDYHCLQKAIASLGRRIQIVDPRDVAALQDGLLSDEFPIVMTLRSQSKDWILPPAGTEQYDRINDKILITIAGNPPYYDGSFEFHKSTFRKKLTLLSDQDSLSYAQSINLSGARLLPHRQAFHDFALDDEAAWIPTSRRQIPILFAATCKDPEAIRLSWRQLFVNFPEQIKAIDAAAEILINDLSIPVHQALSQAASALALPFNLRSRAGRIALSLITNFVSSRTRRKVIERIARYPSLIISDGTPPVTHRHRDCVVAPPVNFVQLLDTMKRSRCIVAMNPNGMTGAISERVPNALRRGAVVVHAPNSALRPLAGAGLKMLGRSLEGIDDWLEAAATGSTDWDVLGESNRQFASTRLRMDDLLEEIFQTALDPATWAPPPPGGE